MQWMRLLARAVACAGMIAAAPLAAQRVSRVPPELAKFEAGLHKQTGDVAISGAKATLHLGDGYYFIPADEARTVLTKVWGNPPDSADGVLGIVFEKGTTIFDNVWGAVVTFQDSGYVSDKDATTEDYDAILKQIRDAEPNANAERQKQGYPTIHLVGWAQPPSYDPAAHSLIWARDLRFTGSKIDSLNYDVRLLGRRGVLSLNMLSAMDHLADVRAAATEFGRAATFDRGATYADYDASVDKTAQYGLAGLVAAGVGAVAVKKLGLLAIVLGLGKKIVVLLAVAGAAIARYFKRLFGRREDDQQTG